ncbi:MAG: hypothetical protein O9972_00715, partial [Burkholderiales bacterium]|nr:hypothetical protein [Burkholderiales bacterium]
MPKRPVRGASAPGAPADGASRGSLAELGGLRDALREQARAKAEAEARARPEQARHESLRTLYRSARVDPAPLRPSVRLDPAPLPQPPD